MKESLCLRTSGALHKVGIIIHQLINNEFIHSMIAYLSVLPRMTNKYKDHSTFAILIHVQTY